MAEITIPAPSRSSWLDRPLLPTWQRIAALNINWELTAYGALVLIGLVMRVWNLGFQAMHHDESVHAWMAWNLFNGTGYHYDPVYHGPLQFEVVALFYVLFGDNEFSARLLAALLGTALIAVPFFLRTYITRPGAVLAALMLTVSPAFVYYSRFIRDDIYLAFFSLVLFVCILHYLSSPRPYLLYVAAAAAALAMASMEAAYLTFFIFGTFLILEGVREYAFNRSGPLLTALRATSLDTWLTSLSIYVVITVLLYSTFFSNPYGIWDTQHSICLSNCFSLHPTWNPNRKDILGGLTYWLVQHKVERGGQPWFYYLLVLPLYEQLAVLFGLAGIAYAAVRRSIVSTFLVWWAVLALALYSWAGEKMPWLSIHIALPFILLAGLILGKVAVSWRGWALAAVASIFALLLIVEVHSTFLLSYVDGTNPTEMLLYVQTSQDVPTTVHEIGSLARQQRLGYSMPIGLDNSDVGGWPFVWYLRHYQDLTETSVFNGPVCNGQYCPVLLILSREFDTYSRQLMTHYVAQRYRWDWWFPEDYKVWFPAHWGAIPQALNGHGSLASDVLGTPNDWSHIWNWLIYRRPFGERSARWLYVLVRRDLVPGQKYFSVRPPGTAPPIASGAPTLGEKVAASLGTGPGLARLNNPRGMAVAPNGDVYVADMLDHRVVEFSATGSFLRAWGSAGVGKGQFSPQNSPEGVAVGPNGDVYVADTWNQRIQVFDSKGRFIRQWGGGPVGTGRGQFYGPRSIAVSGSGRVYVADTGNKRIQVFTADGRFLSSWGTPGAGPGQFDEPSSVAVSSKGAVYVADFWNRRIQEFTSSGGYIRSWPVPDWQAQSYDEPYLAVAPRSGAVFATDPESQIVLEYSSAGRLLGSFGSGMLSLPIGLAVQPQGRVVVSDPTASRVVIFALHPHAKRPSKPHSR